MHRLWSLKTLRRLICQSDSLRVSVQTLMRGSQESSANTNAFMGSSVPTAFQALIKALPDALLRQYEFEDPDVKEGKYLMHSLYFKVC